MAAEHAERGQVPGRECVRPWETTAPPTLPLRAWRPYPELLGADARTCCSRCPRATGAPAGGTAALPLVVARGAGAHVADAPRHPGRHRTAQDPPSDLYRAPGAHFCSRRPPGTHSPARAACRCCYSSSSSSSSCCCCCCCCSCAGVPLGAAAVPGLAVAATAFDAYSHGTGRAGRGITRGG
jgi:hypothetical protein